MDHQLAGAPIDVIKRQAGDLAAAQPQPQQQDDQRVVTPPQRAATITGAQQRPRRPPRLIPRGNDDAPPAPDHQRRLRQIRPRPAPRRKQNRRNARSPDTKFCAALTDTPEAALRSTAPVTSAADSPATPVPPQPLQEPARVHHIADDRARRQAPLGQQIALERHQQQIRSASPPAPARSAASTPSPRSTSSRHTRPGRDHRRTMTPTSALPDQELLDPLDGSNPPPTARPPPASGSAARPAATR